MKLLLILVLTTLVYATSRDGHLKPLGFQRKSEGHIEVLQELPGALTFFNKYVKGSKPVVFKGAAKNHPAFSKWTDEYMSETFGHMEVDIEDGKKENRSSGSYGWLFKDFLSKYHTDNVYMVHSLRDEMLDDLVMFPFLTCGGYTKVLRDVVMWLSSGGTKSVLHNDAFDNLNCLFSGSKRLYMVDWAHREFVDIDRPDGAYSLVDADKVDLDKYPGFAEAPWWEANLEAGDCLFIPVLWFHQVNSFTNVNKNSAVNLWFYHMNRINATDCEGHTETFMPLNKIKSAHLAGKDDDMEVLRYILLLQLESEKEIDRIEMARRISEHHLPGDVTKEDWKYILRTLDKNKDKKVSDDEIKSLTQEELRNMMEVAFPSFAKEEGYGNVDDDGQEDEAADSGHSKDEL